MIMLPLLTMSWKIVINDLPKLKEEVDAMMAGQ